MLRPLAPEQGHEGTNIEREYNEIEITPRPHMREACVRPLGLVGSICRVAAGAAAFCEFMGCKEPRRPG